MSIKNVGSNQFWSPLGPKRIGIQKLLVQKNIETKITRTNKISGPKKFGSKNLQVVIVLPRSYFCELSLCAKFDTHSTIPSLNV